MDVRVFPDRVAGGARRPGCAFFWLLFFAQAKKSDSLNSEALSESL